MISKVLEGHPLSITNGVQDTLGAATKWSNVRRVSTQYTTLATDVTPADIAKGLRRAINKCFKIGKLEQSHIAKGHRTFKLSLHFQVVTDVMDLDESIERRPALIKLLNSQIDPLQRTPLMIACWCNNRRWFEQLLSRDARVVKQDVNGWTALHHAARSLNLPFVKELIDKSLRDGMRDVAVPQGRGRDRSGRRDYSRRIKIMAEILTGFIEAENKSQQTAREVATQTKAELQSSMVAAKLNRRKDLDEIAKIGDRVKKAYAIEAFLLEQGAADHFGRRRRSCCRRLWLVPILGWQALIFVPTMVALLMALPSVRQVPVYCGNLAHIDSGYMLVGVSVWVAVLGLAPLVPFIDRLQQNAAMAAGCVLLILQACVSYRVLTEERGWAKMPRCMTPPFTRGVDARSVVLVAIVGLEGLQQSAFAYVTPLTNEIAAVPIYYPYIFGIVVMVALVYSVLIFTLTLSLAATRSAWMRARVPPLAADTGYRLPFESIVVPLMNELAYTVVVVVLLWMLDCNEPSEEDLGAGSAAGSSPGSNTGITFFKSNADDLLSKDTFLRVHPAMQCWVGVHRWWAALAVGLAVTWQLQTGMFGIWLAEPRVSYGNPCLMVLPPFDAFARLVKLCMAVAAAAFSEHGLAMAVVALCGNLALSLAAGCVVAPFQHRWLNRLRVAMYVGGVVTALSAIAEHVCTDGQLRTGMEDMEGMEGSDAGGGGGGGGGGGSHCLYWPRGGLTTVWVFGAATLLEFIRRCAQSPRALSPSPSPSPAATVCLQTRAPPPCVECRRLFPFPGTGRSAGAMRTAESKLCRLLSCTRPALAVCVAAAVVRGRPSTSATARRKRAARPRLNRTGQRMQRG